MLPVGGSSILLGVLTHGKTEVTRSTAQHVRRLQLLPIPCR
jgi:hypothetical protein